MILSAIFQNKREAEVFRQRLEERFKKYGLELAEEKDQDTGIWEVCQAKTGNAERKNQIPLTFLVSRFIVEWTERSNFSVVG